MENETMTCDRCGGSGWLIEVREKEEVARRCPDCRTSNQTVLRRLAADIPPRYRNQGFSSFNTPHKLQEKALKLAIDFVEDYPRGRGLLFVGPCGVGKTHLSVAILETLISEKGARGRFVDETDLLRRLQYSYGPGSEESERELLQPLRDVDLLVWDDLGTSRSTEWVRETIRMVINHRYTYDKATIFSSNRAIDSAPRPSGEESLEERIGLRLYSRILEMCNIVRVDGPDARRSKSLQQPDDHKLPESPSEVSCPKCGGRRAEITANLDKTSERGGWRDLAYTCQDCKMVFAVKFNPVRDRVEYM